jgi:hypothetical protein
MYLDVLDPLVLSREEQVVSLFYNSERRFRWLRPMGFPPKLRGYPYKRIDVHVC